MTTEINPLAAQLRDRALYLRRRGGFKSSALMEQAATVLDAQAELGAAITAPLDDMVSPDDRVGAMLMSRCRATLLKVQENHNV